jgi:hypothetical protein
MQLVTPTSKVRFLPCLFITSLNGVSDDGNEAVSILVPSVLKKTKNHLNHVMPTTQPAAGRSRGKLFSFLEQLFNDM